MQKYLDCQITHRSTVELINAAKELSDEDARKTLDRWYEDVLEGPGEMSESPMLQVAKLYLAECKMLKETGAKGITINDIAGFLTIPEPQIMPNVLHGPLVFDGYLVAEDDYSGQFRPPFRPHSAGKSGDIRPPGRHLLLGSIA